MTMIIGTIVALLFALWILGLDTRIGDIENQLGDEFWGAIPYDWEQEEEATVILAERVLRSDGTDGSWAGD